MDPVARQPFRADIQGLRAVAVLLVVLYHAHLPGLTGGYVGVDVFFVISGFLITNHLLGELSRSGHIQFARFYARRARRILPAAWVVVGLTMIAALFFAAPLRLEDAFQDAIATVLYVPNVLFGIQNTDYLSDSSPSLFQHYWSLGIEEQFYLVWPLLLVLGFFLARGSRRRLFLFLCAVVLASFAFCVYLTSTAQPIAFFMLPTRAWELGVGGIVAFALGSATISRMPQIAWLFVGWVSGVALLSAAFFFNDATLFPGWAAALPVIATAGLIMAGSKPGPFGISRALGVRPLTFIGGISYSLYLVHWPVLTLPREVRGVQEDLPLWLTLALAAFSLLLAFILNRVVEVPAQQWAFFSKSRPRRTLVGVATVMVVLVGAAGVGFVGYARMSYATEQVVTTAALSSPPSFTAFVPKDVEPAIADADADNAEIYRDGCHADFDRVEPIGCVYGNDPDAPLIALFGDSHAAQWFPAFQTLAESGQIRLRVDTKSSCPAVDVPKYNDNAPYLACDEWRDNVVADLSAEPPDIVVIASWPRSPGFVFLDDSGEEWRAGMESVLNRLPAAEKVILADTPTMNDGLPAACLSAHLEDTTVCGRDRSEAISPVFALAESSAAASAGATVVDLNDYLCSNERCDPVVGRYLVYRDANHLTATISAALAPALSQALGAVLPHSRSDP